MIVQYNVETRADHNRGSMYYILVLKLKFIERI
jgi:hypothetical protein